ncbi:MAG: hypothetical protein IIB73_10990 [Proteobacteria bacterium]|nr:hypothetical protein [Pseudomonadota bacterium]
MGFARMSKAPAARSTLDIALWFQARSDSAGERLPPRKLHFLLYLAQALFAGENEGRKLMPGTFLAGEVGPLEPNIYALFEEGAPDRQPGSLSVAAEEFLQEIWGRFGHEPAKEIERFVHRDGVWEAAKKLGKNAEIPIELMTKLYAGSRVLGLRQAREEAAARRDPDEVFLTPSGQRARKWVPQGSGASLPEPRAGERPGEERKGAGGIRRIIPPPGKPES